MKVWDTKHFQTDPLDTMNNRMSFNKSFCHFEERRGSKFLDEEIQICIRAIMFIIYFIPYRW